MTTILMIFSLGLLLSLVLTPIVGKLGRWGQAMDKPDGVRKSHLKATPRTGGIAIFVAFMLPLGFIQLFPTHVTRLIAQNPHGMYIVLAGFLVFGVGVWDDFYRLNHKIKFLVQILAASMVYACGIRITTLTLVGWMFPSVVSYGVTVLWFLLFINAINLIDGLDGLAAGVCFFCSAVMTVLTILQHDYLAACMFASLSGATLGFLRYNFNPATIFLGDGGSYFLGFAIAVISMMSSVKSQTGAAMMIPILALGVPMFDTILSPLRRFAMGKAIFKPDQGHIHHRIARRAGLNAQKTVWIIYLITAGLCAAALIISNFQDELAGLLLVMIGCSAVFLIRKLGYLDYLASDKIFGWLQDVTDVTGISQDRRSFLNLQFNISYAQSDEELWDAVCIALHKLTFDHAEMALKAPDGYAEPFIWSRDQFDICMDGCRECLMKLELPLVDDAGKDHGTIWLVKDVRKNPVSHYTLKRIEHLRRTVVETLMKMGKN
jgi:UDP-GlcNAc:undecaprenyl-phosphate GlcNAc-1-phosphate transferase